MPERFAIITCLEPRRLLATTLQWSPANEPGSGGFITAISVSPFDSNRVLVGGDMLGVGLSTDRGNTWQTTTGFKSWEMASFTWHPTDANTVWVGSMSGPYVSTDGGSTWSSRRVGMPAINRSYYSAPIEKILFDPTNSNRLLAFGGSRREWGSQTQSSWNLVWQSTNGGATWSPLSTVGTAALHGIYAATYTDSGNLFAAVKGQGIFRSTNGGLTWNLVNTGLPRLDVTHVVADPRGNGTLYTTLDSSGNDPGGVYKSTNNGTNWTAINSGLVRLAADGGEGTSSYFGFGISPANPNILYTANDGWWSSGVFRSTNGGASWSSVVGNGASQPPRFYAAGASAFAIAVDPANANVVFTGSSDKVLRSLNGTSFVDVMSVQSNGAWRGTGFSGLVSVNVKFNPFADQTALLAMDDGKLILSSDGMQTYTWAGSGVDRFNGGNDITFAGPSGSTIYATFGQQGNFEGIGKSTDGGATWSYVTKPVTSGAPTGIYALPSAPSMVWSIVGGNLYRSTNGGSSWTQNIGAIDAASLLRIASDPINPGTFYISSNQGVWKTTDGTSFSIMTGSPTNIDRIVVDPTNPTRLYATRWRTGNSDGLWRFNGSTWSLVRSDYAIHNVAVDPTNGNRIVITTNDHPYHDESQSSGVWLSVDGGSTWSQQNAGLAMTRGEAIAFDPRRAGRIVLGTSGRGFFVTQLDVVAPAFQSGSFDASGVTTAGKQSVRLTFSEDLHGVPSTSDISIIDRVTGSPIQPSGLQVSRFGGRALDVRWNGALPTATFRLVVSGHAIADAAGNVSNEDVQYDFAHLAGDFDQDGTVSFSDLLMLVRNYNSTPGPGVVSTIPLGDANNDGAIDFSDLLIVARNYGLTLPTTVTSQSPAVRTWARKR